MPIENQQISFSAFLSPQSQTGINPQPQIEINPQSQTEEVKIGIFPPNEQLEGHIITHLGITYSGNSFSLINNNENVNNNENIIYYEKMPSFYFEAQQVNNTTRFQLSQKGILDLQDVAIYRLTLIFQDTPSWLDILNKLKIEYEWK